jgi:hypothetical protein
MGFPLAPLTEKGVSIVPFTGGAKFVLDGEVIANWAVAPAKIAEIAGTGFKENLVAHTTAKGNAQSAYEQALQAIGKGSGAKAPSKAPSAAAAVEAAAVKAGTTATVAFYPLSKMKTDPVVPLLKATKVYQPVAGTSSGSRYFAVGISDGLKVAARIKPGTLSVRIEGTQFEGAQATLAAAGIFGPEFGGAYSEKYASMHVDIKGVVDAQKVVGAVLGVLHQFITHPVPDLKPLEANAA